MLAHNNLVLIFTRSNLTTRKLKKQKTNSFKCVETSYYTYKIPVCLTVTLAVDKYCKIGNFREDFIFAKLADTDIPENKTLAKWQKLFVLGKSC